MNDYIKRKHYRSATFKFEKKTLVFIEELNSKNQLKRSVHHFYNGNDAPFKTEDWYYRIPTTIYKTNDSFYALTDYSPFLQILLIFKEDLFSVISQPQLNKISPFLLKELNIFEKIDLTRIPTFNTLKSIHKNCSAEQLDELIIKSVINPSRSELLIRPNGMANHLAASLTLFGGVLKPFAAETYLIPSKTELNLDRNPTLNFDSDSISTVYVAMRTDSVDLIEISSDSKIDDTLRAKSELSEEAFKNYKAQRVNAPAKLTHRSLLDDKTYPSKNTYLLHNYASYILDTNNIFRASCSSIPEVPGLLSPSSFDIYRIYHKNEHLLYCILNGSSYTYDTITRTFTCKSEEYYALTYINNEPQLLIYNDNKVSISSADPESTSNTETFDPVFSKQASLANSTLITQIFKLKNDEYALVAIFSGKTFMTSVKFMDPDDSDLDKLIKSLRNLESERLMDASYDLRVKSMCSNLPLSSPNYQPYSPYLSADMEHILNHNLMIEDQVARLYCPISKRFHEYLIIDAANRNILTENNKGFICQIAHRDPACLKIDGAVIGTYL